jgi:hypothetical protein
LGENTMKKTAVIAAIVLGTLTFAIAEENIVNIETICEKGKGGYRMESKKNGETRFFAYRPCGEEAPAIGMAVNHKGGNQEILSTQKRPNPNK